LTLDRFPGSTSLGLVDKALAPVDHRYVTPASVGQAEVEQPMLQHLPSDRDGLALEQCEIGDPQHTGPMLLQEHHLLRRVEQLPSLLDTALDGPLAAKPHLARKRSLQVEEKGLGFQLRRLDEHRHQDAVPDLRKGVSSGAPMATRLLLPLGLQLTDGESSAQPAVSIS
jgi:hypothetical protein